MVGAGGVIAVMFSAYFGRLPVLFWFMVVALATAAGQAGSHGFNGFFAPRVLNGFFAGAAQGVSLLRTVLVWKLVLPCKPERYHVHQRHVLPP